MDGYITNIEDDTLANENFRKVLYTDERLQLVIMSVAPSDDIGEEVHEVDQFIRIESGEGKSVLNGETSTLKDGSVVVIPAGTKHNIVNTSSENPLKLYTLYAPPNHREGVVHKTKAEAEADEEHFQTKPREYD